MDDAALFEAWLADDREAGAELIRRHYDSIVRFFRTKTGPAADELVQQTFLACAEARQRYRGESGFRAFLFGIARHKFYEHLRRRARHARVDADFGVTSVLDLDPGVSTVVAERSEQRLMVAALQRIPAELQLVLELYYWEDLSVAELAEVLEIPAGTIKSRLYRGRKLLREAMEKVPAAEDDRRSVRSVIDGWAADVKAQLQQS